MLDTTPDTQDEPSFSDLLDAAADAACDYLATTDPSLVTANITATLIIALSRLPRAHRQYLLSQMQAFLDNPPPDA